MSRNYVLVTMLLTLLSVFSGCNKEAGPTDPLETDDEFAVTELALSDTEELLFELGLNDGDEASIGGLPSAGKGIGSQAPIPRVLNFGRHLFDVPRRRVIEIFHPHEDTMKISVERVLGGNIITVANTVNDSGEVTDSLNFYRKPLSHLIQRKAVFTSTPPGSDRRWALHSVSLADGHSLRQTTIQLTQVEITSSTDQGYVFTDPLETFLQVEDEIPAFKTGTEVTFTVRLNNLAENPLDYLGNGATETLLLHYRLRGEQHHRLFFDYAGSDDSTGEQIYTGTWTIGQVPGIYHAIVDGIDNGTIYDDDGEMFPYNSDTWGIPYRVVE